MYVWCVESGQSSAVADFNLLDTARKVELYGIQMYPAKVLRLFSLKMRGSLKFKNCQMRYMQHFTAATPTGNRRGFLIADENDGNVVHFIGLRRCGQGLLRFLADELVCYQLLSKSAGCCPLS